MNVFHSFTRRSLQRNRMRTLVTLIGIILSMALVTAVIEGAYSGVQYLIRWETDRVGAFHGYYSGLTEEETELALQSGSLKKTAVWQTVGWAEVRTNNPFRPYLRIEAIDADTTELVSIHLLSGRLPENGNELLLPARLLSDGGPAYAPGDTVTLSSGERTLDGASLPDGASFVPDSGETLTQCEEKTYTVVGLYSSFTPELEPEWSAGYTALTFGEGRFGHRLFFTLPSPAQFYRYADTEAVSSDLTEHSDLLRFSGAVRNGNLSAVIYGFAAVLIFLIAFGSVSLIYNSFSISVSERTKQFGILKSVGATKKQIRSCVLYEALLLSLISIPIGLIIGCTGIGITLYALRDAFASIAGASASTVPMRLVLNPGALVIASVVCLVTTLVSAWIPAGRTTRISAIDAIRQSEDTSIRSKEVRTSRLTLRLFGFEGMMAAKSFKRSRKRYRSTVVSLFLSVTLFISASSFCAYLTDSVNGVASSHSGNAEIDLTYYTVGEDRPDPETVSALLTVEGVTKSAYFDEDYTEFLLPADCVSESLWSAPFFDREEALARGVIGTGMELVFLSDDAFRELLSANGLSEAPFFNAEAPQAVFLNSETRATMENGSTRWFHYSLLKESSLPCTVRTRTERGLEGYTLLGTEKREDGVEYALYYENGWLDSFWEAHYDDAYAEPDSADALAIPADETFITTEYTAAAAVEETVFPLSPDTPCVIYPYSMRSAVLPTAEQRSQLYQTDYCFLAENHAQVFREMKSVLTQRGMDSTRLNDRAESMEAERMMLTVVNVFSYGFIILISLIAIANVFNTISTGISLRRREFAMLKSIGLSEKGFRRMMTYECVIYGSKSLLWGLPCSVLVTYVIYRITGIAYSQGFYIPWYSVLIAVGSVFLVVFATTLYAVSKLRKDNPIDALKNENL